MSGGLKIIAATPLGVAAGLVAGSALMFGGAAIRNSIDRDGGGSSGAKRSKADIAYTCAAGAAALAGVALVMAGNAKAGSGFATPAIDLLRGGGYGLAAVSAFAFGDSILGA